jgi:uncharacterized protein
MPARRWRRFAVKDILLSGLVQVGETLVEAQTRKRETLALGEAMAELSQKTGTIVTKNEEERIAIGDGIIEVVPIWRFLLDLPGQASPGGK